MKNRNWKTFGVLLLALFGHLSHLLTTGATPETKMPLAASPAGRIALHLVCAIRDHKFHWHWEGVAREFFRAPPEPSFLLA